MGPQRSGLARELRKLEMARLDLPATGDVAVIIPPAVHGYVRRVPMTDLELWYSVGADAVAVWAVFAHT